MSAVASKLEQLGLRRELAAAHQKIGVVRKIVDRFWRLPDAHHPYNRATAWAMHVVIVQVAAILSRSKSQLNHAEALEQDCPFCGAKRGAPCVVARPGEEPSEQPTAQPHWSRIARAQWRRL